MINNYKTRKISFNKFKAFIVVLVALILGAIIIALVLTGFPSSKKVHNKGVYVLERNLIESRL